jgi:TetR/AcrR family transcriptional repressor of nem operon
MPLSKQHKTQTRQRILDNAGAMFRRDGVDGVSVPGLMKEAGLTHGGFYAHFDSKDALVAEVIRQTLDETSKSLARVAKASDTPVAAIIDHYVDADHRDHPEAGCSIAALGAEAARGDERARKAMAESVAAAFERVGEAAGLEKDRQDDVIALYAGMIGAMVLARACSADDALSDRILSVCSDRLKKSFAD